MTTPDDSDVSVRDFVEKVREKPPNVIRALAEENFLLASNILTYNWINGNPRAEWDGKPFDWFPVPRHYEDMYNRIRAHHANMFLAARKHTKTTFVQSLMIWKSEYTPGHTSLYWANTKPQVEDRMREFDEIVKANPWLENVHTDTSLTSKHFPNGARIDTTSVTGAYEGGHVDLQIGDDPMKELGDISDEEIEGWYGRVIVPTLNPGDTLQAVIGTRKRPSDLYELLRRKHESEDFDVDIPGYSLVEYPAVREVWLDEYDRQGDLAPAELYRTVEAPELARALDLPGDEISVLWPEARPPEWLAQQLGMQGRAYFSREFCMVYREAEDAIVQRPWIERSSVARAPPPNLRDDWKPAGLGNVVNRKHFDEVIVGHDPAGSGRDRFAFVTVGTLTHPPETLPEGLRMLARTEDGGYQPVQLRHILDVWQAQDVPPSRWRDKLTALYNRYRPDEIAIESNLNGTWVSDDEEIPEEVRRVIEPVATTRRKHSWKEGVPAIGADIEVGRYRFYTEGGSGNMTDELVTALTGVTRKEGELVGHTPDLVMALYMAHKRLSDSGGYAASSRTSLKGAESESSGSGDREKRESLRGSPVGEAILDTADRRSRWG